MPSAAEIVAALTIYMYGGWQAMALRVGVCMSWAGCARHLHQLTVLHSLRGALAALPGKQENFLADEDSANCLPSH